MKKESNSPVHPGIYVKESVIPSGVTVKKAAEMMDIGRPALSNFLNGKANLSQNMAARLAKAFGVDKSKLLNLQQEYTAILKKEDEDQIAVRSYAPSFLNIRAAHIDAWAEKMDARSLLPALLRILVNSTGSEISHSDFPAYDNSQRHGWDGYVESNNVTPWVPNGVSGWEFGCNKVPSTKANSDYSMRTENAPEAERKNTIFIFVTPHKWNKKDDWIKLKREKNEWKDVRAYDANDLEQWLELSVYGQVWLAEKIGINQEGCQALDDYWNFWSETGRPPISEKIFDSAIAVHGDAISKWYQTPATRPLVVTAGSKEEALAFLACAFRSVEGLEVFADQAVLVSNSNTAKRLSVISTKVIPIACTDDAEAELVISFKNRHSIVVAEKNLMGIEADIVVDLPSYESFRGALSEMGFDESEIEIHSSQCGKSPTILRRQLATIPALKKPCWAVNKSNIRLMIPLVLAGTWKSDSKADKEILSNLVDSEYPNIERSVANLASMDDAPIWIEGRYRGVVSKLDCFHAISDQITEDDVSKFFFIAEYVLSEDDPALDLEKDKRWLANVYDKVRDHSGAIRESICETLIILSIYGDGLFGNRWGNHVGSDVSLLIRKLLKDKNERVWQSQQNNLPRYAEAAPEEFLDIVEAELLKEKPAFGSLFESVGSGMFSSCDRTGMLWALELLAWEPSRLFRVSKILAQLCSYKLEDNWTNKPIGSLADIFLSWLPHTSASLEQRCDVLEFLCKEYPDVGWNICMRQLKPGGSSTSGTYRPRWRSDASGAGQVVTNKDVFDFNMRCKKLVLSWPVHTKSTLTDLIDSLVGMGEKDRETVEVQIATWLDSSPSDMDILLLREHVRTRTMTRRARKGSNTDGYANGKRIYDLLEPQDIVNKHQWLFSQQWVEYTPEELEADLDFQERDKKLSKCRVASLKEVLDACGVDGVLKLCLNGDAGFNIGFHLARDIMDMDELQAFVVKCLTMTSTDQRQRIDRCLSGILHQFGDDSCEIFLKQMTELVEKTKSSIDKLTRLYINAPFTKTTWNILCALESEIEKNYWQTVYPGWSDFSPEDLNYLLEKLMEAGRPRSAFGVARLKPDLVESTRLIKLLSEVATKTSDHDTNVQATSYEIEKALESLNQRDDVGRMELVRLEYLYIQLLTPYSKFGIPNISREIAGSPLLFMQMLALSYRRNDNGSDPDEWQLPTEPDHRQNAASNAHNVLEYANVIPGTQDNGAIDIGQLRDWVIEVRSLAKENGRAEIGDQKIGLLLSKSGIGLDGIWPPDEVRVVFDEIASKEISIGMEIGKRNSRGAGFRPDDGEPERTLASKYRDFAESVISKTPFTGRMLMNISKSYEHEADWHDTDGRVRKRLRD